MKKVQINRILKGIKLAVEVLNLESDKWFIDSPEEIAEIDKAIKKAKKAAEVNHLVNVGFNFTIEDKNVLKANLQHEGIEKVIYSRNETEIIAKIDISKINE